MTRCRLAVALTVATFACLPGLSARLLAEEPAPKVILDMDTIKHEAPKLGKDKTPGGTVELVDGKLGKACKFTFVEGAQGGFFTAWVNATPDWDKAAGFSFWVKGDGSASWGGLELIDGENYGFRYGYCFPIDSAEWKKITVPWSDLIPELPPADFVNPKTGYAPSKFRNFWFGKWFYWRDYPAESFTVDQVALEPEIAVDTKDYTPATGGLPKLLEKLKAKQPVTIVTMGDSLSDKRHWANREVLWSEVLVADLKKTYGGEVKLVNTAIGGTLLQQNLILMPRWLKDTPAPDLVTVCFGFNDWDGGMRGEKYKAMLRHAVDRIRRITGGKSEVVLMTTCPAMVVTKPSEGGQPQDRWVCMEELAEAARVVAKEKKTGLADIAAAFHKAGEKAPAREPLYCNDHTHLGKDGHTLVAQTVLEAIQGGGK